MNNIIFSKDYTMPFKRKFTKRRTTRKPTMKKVERQIHKIQANLKASDNYHVDTGAVQSVATDTKLATNSLGWATATGWTVANLTNLPSTPPLSTLSQMGSREGPQVTFTKLDVKYWIAYSPIAWSSANNSVSPPFVRVIILLVKQMPQVSGFGTNSFAFNDIFLVPPSSIGGMFQADAGSAFNPLTKKNFRVLHDKFHFISANGAYQYGPNNHFVHKIITFKKPIVTTYNDGTINISSMNQNHIVMLALYGGLNASVATTLPGVIYNVVEHYHE